MVLKLTWIILVLDALCQKRYNDVTKGLQLSADALQIAQDQIGVIVAQAQANPHVEVCGLLGGQGGRVLGVYPVENRSSTPAIHFLMGDQSFVDAYLDIEARGWDLVAIYHSHPVGTQAVPSPTDVANANYPETLNLIVSFDGDGQPVARVFRIIDGQVLEIRLEIVPGKP